MKTLITFLILSSVAFSSERSLTKFCNDMVYVRNLMKMKSFFDMKVLGHIHTEYDEMMERREGLKEDLIQERQVRMEKAKRVKPLWTCEVQGIMENVNNLHHLANKEVRACVKAREEKSAIALDREIDEAWALALEKVTELKDVKGKNCKESLDKLLRGAGTKYLSAARYTDICHLMVKDINSVQKISEKCSD